MEMIYVCGSDLGRAVAWSTHVREVVEEFRRRGHGVTILAPEPSSPVPWADSVVWVRTPFRRGRGPAFAIAIHAALRRVLRRVRPAVVYEREIPFAPFLPHISRRAGARHIVEINGIVVPQLRLEGQPVRAEIARWCQFIKLGAAHGVVVVEEADGINQCLKALARPLGGRYLNVPNGVNPDRLQPRDRETCRRELGLPPARPDIVFVGQFYPHHGIEVLLDSLPEVLRGAPDAHMLLVGDGPLRPVMEGLVRERGLGGHVTFAGEVPHDRIPLYLGAASAGVSLITRALGCSSIKIYECLACGVPLVRTAPAGWIEENRLGRVIPEDARHAGHLAEALVWILTNPREAAEMARRGRDFAVRHRSWKSIVDRIEAYIMEPTA
ncbi:MAG: glycosyltransferase family 4 protein [Planctomycetota bacterium]